jgi:hypothetical protein
VTGLAIELTGVADSERPAAKRAGAAKAAAPPRPQLPGGGRRILPDRRVVALYGHPADRALGILGIGKPRTAGRRLLRQAKAYERKTRPVLPAMELLATIATFDAGEEGLYRRRTTNQVIRRYLDAARDIGAILLLDIQPGRADFFSETVALERWLREPDVSLALDPEWRVTEGQVPGQVIGRVEPREVNATTAWLDQLTAKHDLPQKLVVIHQFTDDMVDATQLKPRDNVAIVLNADGFGGRAVKESKYHAFTEEGEGFETGFKLFYEEDVGLMKPAQVLRLRPPPDLVVYE